MEGNLSSCSAPLPDGTFIKVIIHVPTYLYPEGGLLLPEHALGAEVEPHVGEHAEGHLGPEAHGVVGLRGAGEDAVRPEERDEVDHDAGGQGKVGWKKRKEKKNKG